MSDRVGVLASINVSLGGLPKLPIVAARASATGLDGDRQRNRAIHGGPDRAVCLFAMERIEALQRDGHPIAPGITGENLTIRGLDWNAILPGAVLRVGDVTIEITAFANPCASVRSAFADGDATRIAQLTHPGWSRAYGRIVGEGELRVGDAVTLVASAAALV